MGVALVICCANTALMVALAIHNRRSGWRRPQAETAPRPGRAVWRLFRQIEQLRRYKPAVFRSFPPAAVTASLLNLQQTLDRAAPKQNAPAGR